MITKQDVNIIHAVVTEYGLEVRNKVADSSITSLRETCEQAKSRCENLFIVPGIVDIYLDAVCCIAAGFDMGAIESQIKSSLDMASFFVFLDGDDEKASLFEQNLREVVATLILSEGDIDGARKFLVDHNADELFIGKVAGAAFEALGVTLEAAKQVGSVSEEDLLDLRNVVMADWLKYANVEQMKAIVSDPHFGVSFGLMMGDLVARANRGEITYEEYEPIYRAGIDEFKDTDAGIGKSDVSDVVEGKLSKEALEKLKNIVRKIDGDGKESA